MIKSNEMKKKNRKENEKILESKRIIEIEKKKIKNEKRNQRRKRIEKFKKSKFGKSKLGKIFLIFSRDKETYSFSEVFSITIFSLILGAFAYFSVFTIFTGGRNYFKLSKDLGKFFDAYTTIVDNYYGDIDKQELVEYAIDGMVSSVGDVYTNYVDGDSTSEFDEMVNGTYEGIGCTILQEENSVSIVDVYEGTPSEKAGLKSGDKIKSVDGNDALTLGVEKLSNYIKNESNGNVTMIVERDGKEITFTLKRDKVEIPAVNSKIFDINDKKVGYLGISIFSSVSNSQFKEELDELEKDGITSLVIDVRGNNGGYLTAVSDIASYLLPKGKIIYKMQKGDDITTKKDKTGTKREYPIAILTDGGSASASEILAGVIKESYGGYVVGTKTYGKGTVQQVDKLSDGSMIKYTVENWLTPNGNWINGSGIEPTHEVQLDEGYISNPSDDTDNQLQKALELVSK